MGTGWSEGTWDGEEDGFFVFGQVGDGGSLEFTRWVEVRECCVWELVSDGDSGGDCGFCGGEFEGFWVVAVVFEGEGSEGEF